MKRTMRPTIIFLLTLVFPLGLAFLLALARPVVAEPVAVTPLPPVEGTDRRAGACYSYYYDPSPDRPFIQMAYDAGSRWDRFDFIWPNLEPANDAWDPDILDAYDSVVDDLYAGGMNMVGILLWTPDWAATSGAAGLSLPNFDERSSNRHAPVPGDGLAPLAISANSSPPQGLYLSWNDPNNHWGDFVYTIVSRYGDRVKHWEVWNEVDDGDWDYFWTGTEADYAQLLKVGYQATKAACPDCDVLYAGLLYWSDTEYFRRVLDILDDDPDAPAHDYFFDIMSVHLYSRSSNTYDEVNNIRSGMSVYNVADHPIWLTETGVPIWDDGSVDPDPTEYDYAATQEEAAAFVVQSYANGWASDIERYFFFRTHDDDMSEYFGLIRNDHSLRPAYVAYQVAVTYLISPTFVTREPTGSLMNVTLWGTPRGKVSVLWNESPVTDVYTLQAAMPTATFVDRWGVTRTVTATDVLTGTPEYYVYTATLPAATANLVSDPSDYIIGGEPLIVVETETPSEPPTSTVHPLPEVTYFPSFTVTWEGQDNQSGVGFYDIQVRDGVNGGWIFWKYLTSATSGQFTGQHDHTYYFRSRAIDRVGNREIWPGGPYIHTTLDLSSTLHLSIGLFFADENRNNTWDVPITSTNEITLTQVTLHFRDEAGQDVVSPSVDSASWGFTTTVYAGQTYQLRATSADYMYVRYLPLTWPQGGEVYTRTYEALGLWPVMWNYFPIIMRGG